MTISIRHHIESIIMKTIIILLLLFPAIFITRSQTIILDEDFENLSGLPPGWDESTTMPGTHWQISPVANTHYLVIPYHTTIAALNEGDTDRTLPGEYLITPALNLSEFSSVFLSAEIFFKAMDFQNITEVLTIEVSTDDGNTWTPITNIEGYFNWHKVYCDISEYCGMQEVKIAFKYSDGGGWLYGLGIDNVKIVAPFANDGALQDIEKYDFVLINEAVNIKGVVQNAGTEIIQSFDINWMVNGGDVVSDHFGSKNLSPLDTFNFIHSITWIPATQEAFDVKVWISNVNGIPDENPTNDTLSMHVVNAVSSKPEKKVFLEVFGATWCTLCPHGGDKISEIRDSTDKLIVAVAHIDDPLTCTVGTDIFENYHLFPGWLVTGLIDRYDFSSDVSMDMDRYLWPHHVFQREKDISPVELSVSNNYDTETRELDIFLSATFKCDLTGDFRFNCYLVEDSIIAEQANCFIIPERNPYCFKDYWIYNPPKIIENFIHMNVLREVLGGSWGTEGSLPEHVYDGNSYDYQYNYTIPEGFEDNNLRIIGVIQKYESDSNKCEVFNAIVMNLDIYANSGFIPSKDNRFIIYPHPASEYLIVEAKNTKDFWIEVNSLNGETVMDKKADNSKEIIDISGLTRGVYLVRITQNRLIHLEKIVII